MKNKFYYMSVGECVNQVYEIEANNWYDAKKAAFADMAEGDHIVECGPSAVIKNDQCPDYRDIDFDKCVNAAKLCKGVWATKTPSGVEYWESRAWYFDDAQDTYLNGNGAEFIEWEVDVDE